jgi:BirA family biotin operon repressor/biotin-[acetyl-CoA-carboxylase] ligase
MAYLPPLPLVRVHLDVVDSTNSWVKRSSAELLPGALTAVTATEQTGGRGRGSRTWSSSGADDIKVTFAFTLAPAQVATAYLLSPLLCVTARRALSARGVGGCQIKWPNDLLMGGRRKVGGILCEMEGPLAGPQAGGSAGHFLVALGLGLNVNSLPEALGVERPVWPLSTLRAEAGGARLDAPALLEAIVQQFSVALPHFLAGGFAPFRAEYEAGSVLLGRRIRMQHGEAGGVVEGLALGVAEDGRLLVQEVGAPVGAPPRGFLSGEVSGIQLAEGEAMVTAQAEGAGSA